MHANSTSAALPPDFVSAAVVAERLGAMGYISSDAISMAVFLADRLTKPVLVEGPAGVGKTALATSLAEALGYPLIRLQCYEGLDETKALYEWKYGKQLLYTQILREQIRNVIGPETTLEASLQRLESFDDLFFSRQFLEPRPLLRALEQQGGSLLLIDEIDKADEEFEAFLLEILSDYQASIPEIGVVRAIRPPLVFLTSNSTRELGDALRRRCLHLHIDYPDPVREREIVRARVPGIEEALLRQLVAFIQSVRNQSVRKPPSISETVDWARTLMLLHADLLDPDLVRSTLSVILKRQGDIREIEPMIETLTHKAISQAAG